MRYFKIKATGKYLPETILFSQEIEIKMGYPAGSIMKSSGIMQRYIVTNQSTAYMAAQASFDALRRAGLQPEDLGCIVSACGVGQQAIPATACLIQKELGLHDSGIPAFDINSTCLSFLTALDVCSCMLSGSRYENILIVSSDMPSIALNQDDFESSTIFGDGAATMIISPAQDEFASKILASSMETYSSGSSYCKIQGGGTQLHPTRFKQDITPYYFFEMDGKALYRLTLQYIDDFLKKLLDQAELGIDKVDWIVPHQASLLAMKHLQKKLKINPEKIINILRNHGNQVAASMPTAFHEGVITNRFQKGDKILLIGTSAGLSIGGMIIEY